MDVDKAGKKNVTKPTVRAERRRRQRDQQKTPGGEWSQQEHDCRVLESLGILGVSPVLKPPTLNFSSLWRSHPKLH